jgi:hypothetical protein
MQLVYVNAIRYGMVMHWYVTGWYSCVGSGIRTFCLLFFFSPSVQCNIVSKVYILMWLVTVTFVSVNQGLNPILSR